MVTNIINLIVECMKLLLCMCGILNYKFRKSVAAVILLVLSIIVLVVMGIVDNQHRATLFIMISIIICVLSVEGKRKTLFCPLSFFVICCIDDLLMLIVKIVLSIPSEAFDNNSFAGAIVNSLSLVLLTGVAMALQHFYYKKRSSEKYSIHNSSILYIVLFLIGQIAATIYIAPFTLENYKNTLRNDRIVAVSVCILSILFFILGTLLIYNNSAKKRYKQVAEINKKLLETQQDYYMMLIDKDTETRKFRHDISNHILCVDTLIKQKEYEEAEKYLADLRDSLSDLRIKYQTGNMLVNAIVNDISSKYESVNFVWEGMFPQNLKLSNMDLCVIFSNVLENAFYAASGCTEQGNVNVAVKSITNSIMICVENDISAPVKEAKGKFLTQKTDKKNHGFGTMNVRTCVNTNGGSVEYKYTDKIFTVEITLPNVVI